MSCCFHNPRSPTACLTTVFRKNAPCGVLLILVAALIVIPYAAGISPKTRQQWRWMLVVLVFLLWLLGAMGTLRAIA
jgi:hypothetical protein